MPSLSKAVHVACAAVVLHPLSTQGLNVDAVSLFHSERAQDMAPISSSTLNDTVALLLTSPTKDLRDSAPFTWQTLQQVQAPGVLQFQRAGSVQKEKVEKPSLRHALEVEPKEPVEKPRHGRHVHEAAAKMNLKAQSPIEMVSLEDKVVQKSRHVRHAHEAEPKASSIEMAGLEEEEMVKKPRHARHAHESKPQVPPIEMVGLEEELMKKPRHVRHAHESKLKASSVAHLPDLGDELRADHRPASAVTHLPDLGDELRADELLEQPPVQLRRPREVTKKATPPPESPAIEVPSLGDELRTDVLLEQPSMQLRRAHESRKKAHHKHAATVLQGDTATLDESGYQALAARRDSREMWFFIRRAVEAEGAEVVDEGMFNGLVPYYSGEKDVQSFDRLREELFVSGVTKGMIRMHRRRSSRNMDFAELYELTHRA